MRFIVDAQLPPGLAVHLTQCGHSAEHVNRIGLGTATDQDIWHHAANIGAVLVTKDQDFIVLAEHDLSGPQVVWVRVGNISNAALWRSVEPLLQDILDALNAGERIVQVVDR